MSTNNFLLIPSNFLKLGYNFLYLRMRTNKPDRKNINGHSEVSSWFLGKIIYMVIVLGAPFASTEVSLIAIMLPSLF